MTKTQASDVLIQRWPRWGAYAKAKAVFKALGYGRETWAYVPCLHCGEARCGHPRDRHCDGYCLECKA